MGIAAVGGDELRVGFAGLDHNDARLFTGHGEGVPAGRPAVCRSRHRNGGRGRAGTRRERRHAVLRRTIGIPIADTGSEGSLAAFTELDDYFGPFLIDIIIIKEYADIFVRRVNELRSVIVLTSVVRNHVRHIIVSGAILAACVNISCGISRNRQLFKVFGNDHLIDILIIFLAHENHFVSRIPNRNGRGSFRPCDSYHIVIRRRCGFVGIEVQDNIAVARIGESVTFNRLLRSGVHAHLDVSGKAEVCHVQRIRRTGFERFLLVNSNGRVCDADTVAASIRTVKPIGRFGLCVPGIGRSIGAGGCVSIRAESQIALVLRVHIRIVEVGVHLVGKPDGDEHADSVRSVGTLGGYMIRRFLNCDGKLRVFTVRVGRTDGHRMAAVRFQIVGVNADGGIIFPKVSAIGTVCIGQGVAVRILKDTRQIGLPDRYAAARSQLAGSFGSALHSRGMIFDIRAGCRNSPRVHVGLLAGRGGGLEAQRMLSGFCRSVSIASARQSDSLVLAAVNRNKVVDAPAQRVLDQIADTKLHRLAGFGADGAAVRAHDHRVLRVVEDHGGVAHRVGAAVVCLELKTGSDKAFAVGVGIGLRVLQLSKLAAVDGNIIGQRIAILIGKECGNVGAVGIALRVHHRVQRNAGCERRGGVGNALKLYAEQCKFRVVGTAVVHGQNDHFIVGTGFELCKFFRRNIIQSLGPSFFVAGIMPRQRYSKRPGAIILIAKARTGAVG